MSDETLQEPTGQKAGALIARIRANTAAALRAIGSAPVDRQHSRSWLMPGAVFAALSLIAFVGLLLDPIAPEWARQLPLSVHKVFQVVTDLGGSEVYLVPIGLILIGATLIDWSAVAVLHRERLRLVSERLGFLFIAIAVPSLSVTLIKRIIGRARPKLMDETGVVHFQPIAVDADFASFPSGHATTAAAAAVALSLVFPRFRLVFLTIALWVGVSRVILRAHYPSDVVAGFLFAGFFVVAIAWFFARRGRVFRVSDTALPSLIPIRSTFADLRAALTAALVTLRGPGSRPQRPTNDRTGL